MISRAFVRWIVCAGAVGAAISLAGCSSGKPYALVADLPSTGHVVIATINVSDGNCSVRIASLDWNDFYTPSCKVLKDQSGFKSFSINGSQVDFGAVDAGFKVLGTPPKLPGAEAVAAPAAGTGKAAAAATAKPATPAPAAGTAAPAVAVGQDFPSQWTVQPDPGQQHLVGQTPGFLLTSNKLMVSGGACMLDVTFKATYKPLHMPCIVTTDIKGDFRLVFNPRTTGTLSAGGNYDVSMVSEGSGISGVIWDSHGFDDWTPSLPPQWTVSSTDSDQ
ncbi:MAG TPA: hypothetical protein VGT99_07695 [Gammaproteobacteria bacterium]|nr:hypothetical protein [Gammaproteobacteria bacterium]